MLFPLTWNVGAFWHDAWYEDNGGSTGMFEGGNICLYLCVGLVEEKVSWNWWVNTVGIVGVRYTSAACFIDARKSITWLLHVVEP